MALAKSLLAAASDMAFAQASIIGPWNCFQGANGSNWGSSGMGSFHDKGFGPGSGPAGVTPLYTSGANQNLPGRSAEAEAPDERQVSPRAVRKPHRGSPAMPARSPHRPAPPPARMQTPTQPQRAAISWPAKLPPPPRS